MSEWNTFERIPLHNGKMILHKIFKPIGFDCKTNELICMREATQKEQYDCMNSGG